MSMFGECHVCGRTGVLIERSDGQYGCADGCPPKSAGWWIGPAIIVGVILVIVVLAVLAVSDHKRTQAERYALLGREVIIAGVRGTLVAYDNHRTFTVLFPGPPTTQVAVDINTIIPSLTNPERP